MRCSLKADELWANNAYLQNKTPEDLKRHLPIMLFDDAGPIRKTKSGYARQMFSLLGKGKEIETRFSISTGLKGGVEDDNS